MSIYLRFNRGDNAEQFLYLGIKSKTKVNTESRLENSFIYLKKLAIFLKNLTFLVNSNISQLHTCDDFFIKGCDAIAKFVLIQRVFQLALTFLENFVCLQKQAIWSDICQLFFINNLQKSASTSNITINRRMNVLLKFYFKLEQPILDSNHPEPRPQLKTSLTWFLGIKKYHFPKKMLT